MVKVKFVIIAIIAFQTFMNVSYGSKSVDNKDIKKEKFIPIFVTPYYTAGKDETEAPKVKTYKGYDHLLASPKKEDLLQVVKQIEATPDMISPVTLFVLSTRLYDLGLKWESVLWFYIAKNRYFETIQVLRPEGLGSAPAAMDAFSDLLGNYVNGFAFCDIKKQQEAQLKALDWTKAHPYKAIYIEKLPAKGPDRSILHQTALQKLAQMNTEEANYFKDPTNLKKFIEQRKKNNMDKKFCD